MPSVVSWSQLVNVFHISRNIAPRQSLWARTPRLYDFPAINAVVVPGAYTPDSKRRSSRPEFEHIFPRSER